VKISSPVKGRRCRIEIIPLIDIMFFLLASFMMVSLQMEQTQNTQVDLPFATQGDPDFKPDMLNIAVDKDGVIWLAKKPVSLPDLGAAVSNRFRLDTNLPVYVSGDSAVLEGTISDVLRAVRNAGVQKVAFMVGDRAQARANP
jgi:biopolymer transport protein ExbD